jgi:hypothetical protein
MRRAPGFRTREGRRRPMLTCIDLLTGIPWVAFTLGTRRAREASVARAQPRQTSMVPGQTVERYRTPQLVNTKSRCPNRQAGVTPAGRCVSTSTTPVFITDYRARVVPGKPGRAARLGL